MAGLYSKVYSTTPVLGATLVPSPLLPSSSFSTSQPTLLIVSPNELIQLLPTLKSLAKSSVVLQVSTKESHDHTRILALRSTGISLLYSSNDAQAAVNSLVAVKVANGGRGVLHFGEFISSVELSASTGASGSKFVNTNTSMIESNGASTSAAITSAADLFSSAYASLPATLSATPLSYFGATSPETLIIALGQTAPLVSALPASTAFVSLNLYRPLSSAQLRELVPVGTKTVVVLEQAYRQVSKWTPLFLDVVGAFAESDEATVVPTILSGSLGSVSNSADAIKSIMGESA